MALTFIEKIFPNESKKMIKGLAPVVDKVFALEEELKALSDAELKLRGVSLKNRVMKDIEGLTGEQLVRIQKQVLDKALPEAFALVRESSRRTLHMMHYRVQVIGGILLHKGHIAEMRTGEDRKSVV